MANPSKLCLLFLMSLSGSLAMPATSDTNLLELRDELAAGDISYFGENFKRSVADMEDDSLVALEARDDLEDADLDMILQARAPRRRSNPRSLASALDRREAMLQQRLANLYRREAFEYENMLSMEEAPLAGNWQGGGDNEDYWAQNSYASFQKRDEDALDLEDILLARGDDILYRRGHTPGRVGYVTPSISSLLSPLPWLRKIAHPQGQYGGGKSGGAGGSGQTHTTTLIPRGHTPGRVGYVTPSIPSLLSPLPWIRKLTRPHSQSGSGHNGGGSTTGQSHTTTLIPREDLDLTED